MAEAIDMTITADATTPAVVLGIVESFCEHHAVPPRPAYVLTLVIEELVTNVVNHAYRGGSGPMELRIGLADGRIAGEVVDSGPPFDPTTMETPDIEAELEDRDIGGLGVHIVKTMVEALDYAREDGRNVLRFRVAL